jgi:predicted nucleic acid-binding protein
MTQAFADTSYWIALLNPQDQLHRRAHSVSASLSDVGIVTSQWILAELLNSFADHGARIRSVASNAVATLLLDSSVTVVPVSDVAFAEVFLLYRERLDKSWSLTDCSTFLIMRKYGIEAPLTYDRHFEQAGFKAILR